MLNYSNLNECHRKESKHVYEALYLGTIMGVIYVDTHQYLIQTCTYSSETIDFSKAFFNCHPSLNQAYSLILP